MFSAAAAEDKDAHGRMEGQEMKICRNAVKWDEFQTGEILVARADFTSSARPNGGPVRSRKGVRAST